MSDVMRALQAPFHPDDIEWRVQQSGISGKGAPWAMVLAYVTNRAIMQRLDEVFGVDGWENKFRTDGDAIECGIGVRFDDRVVWKFDAAPTTDIEAVKGGGSNAMKRAAVQWGIGRYLYKLDATFAKCDLGRAHSNRCMFKPKQGQQGQQGQWGTWETPRLPPWALPDAGK